MGVEEEGGREGEGEGECGMWEGEGVEEDGRRGIGEGREEGGGEE